MWNDKCCEKCVYMTESIYSKHCIIKGIELTNVNAYCSDFEETEW